MTGEGSRGKEPPNAPRGRILIFADFAELAAHAARSLAEAIAAAEPRRATVALAGGGTPAAIYERLARDHAALIPWGRLEIFFGDERAVPPEHPSSNHLMATIALLSRVPVPPGRIHRMRAEEKDLEAAARRYEEEIGRAAPAGPGGLPAFDLIWLGVGEDGHTASLFPGADTLEIRDRLVVPADSPKPPPRRLTFTLPLINAAQRVQFIIAGAKKTEIVRRILAPEGEPTAAPGDRRGYRLPAELVQPATGNLEWLLDRDAAEGISNS